ncbi:MAG TPA: hypothetical protein EYN66_01190, partial [Myxococcales bacterium]|nr:hypothetical protein [Myxococcales bacterium]
MPVTIAGTDTQKGNAMQTARHWALLSLFVVICLAACSKKRTRAGAAAPATAVSKAGATPAISSQQPTAVATKSPLMGTGDAAAKRNRSYPASSFNSVDSLPKNPLKTYLAKQLQSVGATGFSNLWGKTKSEFPALARAELLEVTDIRPWQQIYRVDTQIKAKRKKSMYVEWGFIDGHLYYLRLRFRSGAKNFTKKAARHMKRKSDYKGKNTAGVQEWIWSEGNLQIMTAKKGRSTALQITDRGFAEVATARNAGIEAAERLVYTTTRLISPKTSDIEQMLQNNKKAAKMVPSYGDAWVNICHAYYDMGQQSRALPACNKSLAVTIENSV